MPQLQNGGEVDSNLGSSMTLVSNVILDVFHCKQNLLE